MGCYSSKGALEDSGQEGILGAMERSDDNPEDLRKARFLREPAGRKPPLSMPPARTHTPS
eukprot:2660228-Prymnesium_polylepis.1